MGKDNGGFLAPKSIANRIKAKGLQKLRWCAVARPARVLCAHALRASLSRGRYGLLPSGAQVLPDVQQAVP